MNWIYLKLIGSKCTKSMLPNILIDGLCYKVTNGSYFEVNNGFIAN